MRRQYLSAAAMSIVKKYRDQLPLLLLLTAACILRFYRLTYQSLWHDELFTMNEADPRISFGQMFHLLSLDTHPPLYTLIARISFSIFGYTAWAVRAPAALFGTLNVWTIYLLGKEIKDRRTGLIAAALCCFSYYNLHYSQEGRD